MRPVVFLMGLIVSACLRAENYYLDSGTSLYDEMIKTSSFQILYKPRYRTDIPYTSIYSQAYDEADPNEDPDYKNPFAEDPFLKAQAFSNDYDDPLREDTFGSRKILQETGMQSERLKCRSNQYLTDQVDPLTFKVTTLCANLPGVDLDGVDETNPFLAPGLKNVGSKHFADTGSFILGVAEQAKKTEEDEQVVNDERVQSAINLDPQMLSFLKTYAAGDPNLMGLIEDLESGQDARTLIRRFGEKAGTLNLKGLPLSNFNLPNDF